MQIGDGHVIGHTPGWRTRVCRVTRVFALVLMLALLSELPGVAWASGPSWLPAQTIEQHQDAIYGLSCPSATTCLAASSNPVVQDGGLSYEPDPDPSSILNAVSCAHGTHFCMFVDGNGGAFSYDSGHFGSVVDIDGNVELNSVSCPSSSFCMAIDHSNVVFKYSGGSWDAGTTLVVPSQYASSSFVNVSCATTAFCVALVNTDGGVLYYTWNGTNWSSASAPFDTNAAHTVSLSCTSTSFCLETDDIGQASRFDGTSWSTPHQVDTYNADPVLYSSCVGTNCAAVDFYDNFFFTADGSTWTSGGNIHAGTLISGVESLTCATATLCVAGDGVGDATTYAVPPALGKPALTGTPTVGQTLTLTHATAQTASVWYYDDWRRCANPDATCTLNPISTSTSGYTLTAPDASKYIDAREVIGFGFEEDGPITSNIVGPIRGATTQPGTAKLSGTVTTSSTGIVTIPLRCTGGPCKGAVKLSYQGTSIGAASYSTAAGHTTKAKITLNAAGKAQLHKHHGQLTVKLVIAPARGNPTSQSITLRASG
jgi:hypothetical protein